MGSFTNWRGLSPENTLSRYNDNFFHNSFRRAWDSDFPLDRSGITVPAVNVRDEETAFILEFAAPGYRKSDFEVNIDNHVLTINAKREKAAVDSNNNDGNAQSSEERSQRYTRRSFTTTLSVVALPYLKMLKRMKSVPVIQMGSWR